MLPLRPQVLLLLPSLTQPQPPPPPLWFPYEHPSLLLQGFRKAVTLTRMLFPRRMPASLPHFPKGLVKCHTSAKPSLAKLHKKITSFTLPSGSTPHSFYRTLFLFIIMHHYLIPYLVTYLFVNYLKHTHS